MQYRCDDIGFRHRTILSLRPHVSAPVLYQALVTAAERQSTQHEEHSVQLQADMLRLQGEVGRLGAVLQGGRQ